MTHRSREADLCPSSTRSAEQNCLPVYGAKAAEKGWNELLALYARALS